MRTGPLLLFLFLVLFLAFVSNSAAAKDELPLPHDDGDVKVALERFEKDYAVDDMDARLRMLRWIGLYRHKKVLKELSRIWLKEENLELVGAAAEGLGNQLSHPKGAARLLCKGLEQYKTLAGADPVTEQDRIREDIEARVIVSALQGLGKLGIMGEWKLIKGFIDHNNDDVAIAVIQLCSDLKEYRAIPIIYEWFHHYPDGVSWSGGSVSVDTGAAGSADANAAKAKWRARYGNRAKKGRPDAFAAMVECVKVLTGQEIGTRDELKAWIDENKDFLKKHGV